MMGRKYDDIKSKTLDIIFWIGYIITFAWLILKAAGYINTPIWISMIPIITGAASVGAMYENLRSNISTLKSDVKVLKSRSRAMEIQLVKNTGRIRHISD